MALKFGDAKGSAQKSSLVQYQYVDGDNSVRLVGDILPRYVYWVTGDNNKNIPMECLAFNRNSETLGSFTPKRNVVGHTLFSVFTMAKLRF